MSPSPSGGRDRVRHGVVAAAMLALFVIALGVFLLPFAFPTPPPIVTRFQATQLFSPDGDGRRDVARVNIRLHEASDVTIEIQREGEHVASILDGARRSRGFFSEAWDGRDDAGLPVPDGTYAIRLSARSGKKEFNKPRKIVVDTTAPRPAGLTVASATLSEPGRGECRLELVSRDAASVVLQARRPGATAPVRRLGARPIRAGGTVRWAWDGRGATGEAVPPGLYVIEAALSDAARNRVERVRTCWVGHLAGEAVPARPVPRGRVGVRLRRTDGTPLPPATPVSLVLRRRTGVPGVTPGDPLGEQVGPGARGPAGSVTVRVPAGVNPAALWLVASTRDGQGVALIDLGAG